MSAASRTESEGLVRCFGCGSDPAENTIHRLADGSACPCCVARVVEAQPSLLPGPAPVAERARDEGAASEWSTPEHDEASGEASDVPSIVGRLPGTERFQLLSGGGGSGGSDHGPVPILDPGPPEPA
jgi:hypothetical protein